MQLRAEHVAGYVRGTEEEQRRQESAIREWAAGEGYTVTHVFRDTDETEWPSAPDDVANGYEPELGGFLGLLEALRNREAECMAVYSLGVLGESLSTQECAVVSALQAASFPRVLQVKGEVQDWGGPSDGTDADAGNRASLRRFASSLSRFQEALAASTPRDGKFWEVVHANFGEH